jgi:hypothetical protein
MGARRKFGRIGLVLVAAAMTTASECSEDPDPYSGIFRVLAYNVAGLPQEISTVNPEVHIPMISPLLNAGDIVLTQEDFDWWGELAGTLDFVHYHERLRAEATHTYLSPAHPGPEAVGLDVTTRMYPYVGDGLGTLARFPAQDDVRVPWVGCFGGFDTSDGGAADCLAMKGFSVTTITLADGMVVHAYNLHAEAGGTAADQALQVDDFEQLAAFILDYSDGVAVILGGDTNLHTGGSHPDGSGGADTVIWQEFLAATGLTDACDVTDCEEPTAIDKIAYRSGGGVVLEAFSHQFLGDVFVDPDGEPLSDHDPLYVEFTYAPG